MVNFLRERALAYHKDALQASLKEILEEFENEMKLDFWDVKRASDCEKVLASWNCTLLQCKHRWGGAEDGLSFVFFDQAALFASFSFIILILPLKMSRG